MKKKIIALLLTLTVVLTVFAACGKKEVPDTGASTTTASAAEDGTTKKSEDGKNDSAEDTTEPATEGTTEETTTDKKADTTTAVKESETAVMSDGTVTLANPDSEERAFFPAFETTTVSGKKVSDKIFKGNKITMVNVWGTFCAPCIREMPDLQKINEKYEGKGVKIVGVLIDTYDSIEDKNIESKVEDAKRIIDQTGVKYQNILASKSLNEAKLDYIFSVPTTYFLNEKGEIIGSEYVGSRSFEQWSDIIDDLLKTV